MLYHLSHAPYRVIFFLSSITQIQLGHIPRLKALHQLPSAHQLKLKSLMQPMKEHLFLSNLFSLGCGTFLDPPIFMPAHMLFFPPGIPLPLGSQIICLLLHRNFPSPQARMVPLLKLHYYLTSSVTLVITLSQNHYLCICPPKVFEQGLGF
jgi:hypothetical protein